MVLSIAVTTVGATDGTDGTTDTTTQKVWTPDAEWIADFNAATDKTVFEIGTPEELYALLSVTLKDGAEDAATSRAATAGKTFVLTANLDLEGAEWQGIAEFCGNFDGNGYSISNMVQNVTVAAEAVNNETYINPKTDYTVCAGFFKTVAHTALDGRLYIKDLAINNFDVTMNSAFEGKTHIGGLIGAYTYNYDDTNNYTGKLTIENVMLTDVNVVFSTTWGSDPTTAGRPTMGGFIGSHYVVIVDSTGAIIAQNDLVIDSVMFQGKVETKWDRYTLIGAYIGDLNAGRKKSNSGAASGGDLYTEVSFKNCLSFAELIAPTTASALRALCARGNSDAKKNLASTCATWIDVTSAGALKSNTIKYKNEKALKLTLSDVYGYNADDASTYDGWYQDEVFGIIPKGLADNVIYKMYAQKSSAADANGKYGVRIIGALQSLDLLNVKLDAQVSTDNGATWTTVPVDTVQTVYTSVMAAGTKITAEDLGGKYVYVAALSGISAETPVTVRVTPTKTMLDGTVVTMSTQQITLTFPAAN